jgi:hypothetical protein
MAWYTGVHISIKFGPRKVFFFQWSKYGYAAQISDYHFSQILLNT